MNARRRLIWPLCGTMIIALIGAIAYGSYGESPRAQPTQEAAANDLVIAGPGRVEPASEDLKLGSDLNGRLREVHVDEGALIARGQLLATLENDEYAAAVRAAEAEVRVREGRLQRLINGVLPKERSAALAAVREAEAVMLNARKEGDRGRRLFALRAISSAELETHERAQKVAEAQYQQVTLRHSVIADPPREEDRNIAQAELDLANARLGEARARYEKTLIRSPIDGRVLRRHHREGESVWSSCSVPDPVFTVGSTELLRVRVEIDERDVERVRTGQRAHFTADAFADQKFVGTVARVGEQLGRKNIRTGDPTEPVDSMVLEVLAGLAPGTKLPIGLRVDAFITVGSRPESARASVRASRAEARKGE